jgi:hypothetical protein
MKIADYHRKRRALEMSGQLATNTPNKEETHAHEDHEERPEDVQGPREGGPEGQGPRRQEGRAGEEGSAREVSDAYEQSIGAYGALVAAPLSPAEWEAAKQATGPGTMFDIDRPEKPYLQGQRVKGKP